MGEGRESSADHGKPPSVGSAPAAARRPTFRCHPLDKGTRVNIHGFGSLPLSRKVDTLPRRSAAKGGWRATLIASTASIGFGGLFSYRAVDVGEDFEAMDRHVTRRLDS